jgi:F0F1-type ATP synthase gamma subunit
LPHARRREPPPHRRRAALPRLLNETPRFFLTLKSPPCTQVMLVVLSGDRGLCGGYNNFIIKKARALAAKAHVQRP